MGGTERVARHVAEGRTPVRDRVDQLLDDGSFREIGSLASKVEYDEEGRIKAYTPSNFVTGRGTIDGRPVIIGCDDFTVRGGAADGAVGNKMGWSERTARELRLPARAPRRWHRRRRQRQDKRRAQAIVRAGEP